jgi:hypothetical protein
MRVWQFSGSVQLALVVALAGSWVGVLVLSVRASTPPQPSPWQGEGAGMLLSSPLTKGGLRGVMQSFNPQQQFLN